MLNEGKEPFKVNPDMGYTLDEARRQERKIMNLGLKKFKCKTPQKDLEGKEPLKEPTSSNYLINRVECHHCHSKIRDDAKVCPFCGLWTKKE